MSYRARFLVCVTAVMLASSCSQATEEPSAPLEDVPAVPPADAYAPADVEPEADLGLELDVVQPLEDEGMNLDTGSDAEQSCFLSNRILNIAHRGGSLLAPEHTLVAYQNALDVGADVLELDLHATADGVLVLLHDATVDRTTDGTGDVSAMTYAALQKLDAGYHFTQDGGATFPWRGKGLTVPSLEDVLATFPETCMTVELKQQSPSIVDPVLAAFEAHDATEFACFSAIDDLVLEEIRAKLPSALTGMGMAEMVFLAAAAEEDLEGYEPPGLVAQPPKDLTTAQVIERAHAFDVKVHPWTVNDPVEMKALIERGADGIITDDPEALAAVLAERAGSSE